MRAKHLTLVWITLLGLSLVGLSVVTLAGPSAHTGVRATSPFAITAHQPLTHEVGVALTANITATFDDDVNAGTVTSATFVVHGHLGGLPTGTFAYDGGTRTLTLDPDRAFHAGEVLRVSATDAISSSGGEALTPYGWQFTAGEVYSRCVAGFADIGAGLHGVSDSSVAWGDYDNDGDLDILLTGGDGSTGVSKVYRNDGASGFTDIVAGLTGVYYSSEAWGDYDNDGDLDILLTGWTGSTVVSEVYRNDGDDTFTEIQNPGLTPVNRGSVAWGDYDNDGDLDILLTGNDLAEKRSKVYRNDGGTFTDIMAGLTGVNQSSVAWGDYDNDGDLDILLTGMSTGGHVSEVYRNDGDVFTSIVAGLTTVNVGSVAWGDYDNDGDLDILLTGHDPSGPVSEVYRNESGTFSPISAGLTGVAYSSVAWGDYDNDSDLDILLTGYDGSNHVSRVYRNDGGASGFTDIVAGLTGVYYSSAAWGDYDNDGDLDILLTGYAEGGTRVSEVYRNWEYWECRLHATPSGSGSGDCSSWPNACTLQAALGAAASNPELHEIWVAAGTHKPTAGADRTATFQLRSGVAVYGGFPSGGGDWEQRDPETHVTVLSGDIDNNDTTDPNGVITDAHNIVGDNSCNVVTGSGTDGTAILDGFTITGGYAWLCDHDGGGMYNSQGSPTLTNVAFTGNSGSAMANYDSGPTLTDCAFSGNHTPYAEHYGGGMYNSSSSPRLDNCTFSANRANRAGAIYNVYSTPTLTGTLFLSNMAQRGGGMYNWFSSPRLENCTFVSNTADLDGGGMYNIDWSSPTLTGCEFISNTADDWGGGIRNQDYSSPVLTDCTFSGNTAGGSGGGMYNMDNSSPSLIAGTFINNTAEYGGGMYSINSSSAVLTGTHFISNTAYLYGGGVYNTSSTATLSGTHFISNTAYVNGGAIYNTSSSTALTGTHFISNTAYVNGGAIYNTSSTAVLSGPHFISNTAYVNGGAIYNTSSTTALTGTHFLSNTAGDSGGGMYNMDNSSATLTYCTFSGNRAAEDGGGMYNETDSSPTLTYCTFSGNAAGENGGGICSLEDSDVQLAVGLFSGNRTDSDSDSSGNGGGIYSLNSSLSLINYTLSGNSAQSGGGMYFDGSSESRVLTTRNGILWGNTAGSGGPVEDQQVALSGPISTDFQNTLVQGGCPTGGFCTSLLYSDPQFVDADGVDDVYGTADDDLHLQSTSPAIDHGDNSAVPPGVTTDLDGNPRFYADANLDSVPDVGAAVDLGTYEAQFCVWHMSYGDRKLEDGQQYRLGFHAQIDVTATVKISDTLASYAAERAAGNLTTAKTAYEMALDCGATVTETQQAMAGLQNAIWELATGAMLQGNDEMVKALDLVYDAGELGGEIAQLEAAIGYFEEATAGYLKPLTGDDQAQFLDALQLTRTHPLSDTEGYVDLERLALAVAQKSRAYLELAERQFRGGQREQAVSSLVKGQNAALVELTLLRTLWPDVVEDASYGAVLRSLADMSRIYSYLAGDKNPFGYEPDFVPFRFDWTAYPEKNNYEQAYDIADDDIEDAQSAVATAQGKQKEIDDNYKTMQKRLKDIEKEYDDQLVKLCKDEYGNVDLVNCPLGDLHDQELAVEGAMLRIEKVVGQMDMTLELIKNEEILAKTLVADQRARAQMITDAGEELASLAREEAKLRFARSDSQGFLDIAKKYMNWNIGTSGVSASVSDSGWIGALFEWRSWEEEKKVAEQLGNVYAAKERLYALQRAQPLLAGAVEVEAKSKAQIKKYFLELGQLDIDYVIQRNKLMQELARLASLQGQVQYLLNEKAKAQAFTALLFQDPAGRVLRDHYMEIANDDYERALAMTFEAGRALEYEINDDPPYDGPILHDLQDLYPLQDIVDLVQALDDMENAYTDWTGDGCTGPQEFNNQILYLSEAVGFRDIFSPTLGFTVTREDQFNAFVRDEGNRVDLNSPGDGTAESLRFTFQTSILGGNPAFDTGLYNDRIIRVKMRIRGDNLNLGSDELRPHVRLTQGGTSIVRTRLAFQEQDPEGHWIDDLRTYQLQPKTATILAATDVTSTLDETYELATRSVASTDWTLLLSRCEGDTCGPYRVPENDDLNLDEIDEIELIIDHQACTLQLPEGPSSTAFAEPLPTRPYRPMEHVLPPLSLKRSPIKTRGQMLAHQSTAIELNDTYVGTVAITQPLVLDAIELVVALSDTQGSLSGYISPTLSYPSTEQDPSRGPALSGSWSGNSFVLQSEIFTSSLGSGIPITRQVILHSGVISASGEVLTGAYSETLSGLTPEPLETSGTFRLDRPSHELVAGFTANPVCGPVPLEVGFDDLSLGNPTHWAWDFGDGAISAQQHPTHTYTAIGNYTVTLTVSNTFGVTTTIEPNYISVISSKPALGEVDPSSGSGPTGVTTYFTTTWTDCDGWEDLKQCWFHIGAGPTIVGNVTLMYNAVKDKLWLRSDDGSAWTGGFAPESANVLENSQAIVHCGLTTAAGSGDTLTVKWAIEFNPGFEGTKKLGLKCKDRSKARAKARWKGTWTIE